MRHVDHPHHAEGDGETNGGEQQHRSLRQAEQQIVAEVVQVDEVVDGVEPLSRCSNHLRRARGCVDQPLHRASHCRLKPVPHGRQLHQNALVIANGKGGDDEAVFEGRPGTGVGLRVQRR